MELLLTLCVLLLVFWGVYGGYVFWARNKSAHDLQVKTNPMLASLAYTTTVVAWAVLGAITAPVSLWGYAFFVFGGLILLYGLGKSVSVKAWYGIVPVLCFIGTFALQTFSPGLEIAWYVRIALTLFWSAFIGLFCVFDKIPCCSIVQAVIWGLSALLGLLLLPQIPVVFTLTGSILLAVIWGIVKVMFRIHQACLGIYLSMIFAFVWGGLFTFALMNGEVWCTALMLNAYIFAMTFGLLLSWQVMRKYHVSGKKLVQMVSEESNADAIRCLMTHSGLLSILGVLIWNIYIDRLNVLLGGAMLVIFIDLYLRLRDGGAPAPGIRQIFSAMYHDLKNGIKSEKKEVEQVIEQVEEKESLPKKVKPKTKKTSVKRTKQKGGKRKKK